MENRIDRRISYKCVLDTETCPLDREFEGVTPSNMFVYDIGWCICDKRGIVYRTKSYLVAEIFLDEKALMQSAYYADKIPQYWEDVKNGTREIKTWYNIKKDFENDVAEFGVDEIYAHNMRFDYGSLNNTNRWLSKSKYRYFFRKDLKICDTLKMATDVIATMPTYRRFCEDNGYMTNHKTPRPQLKAETIYRFITNDTDFIESHTGLEDVLIEKEILAYCYRQHKKMRKELFEN